LLVLPLEAMIHQFKTYPQTVSIRYGTHPFVCVLTKQ